MAAAPGSNSGSELERPPSLRMVRDPGRGRRDLARGARGLLLWAAPIGLLVAASALGSLGALSPERAGALSVVGTAWLGGTCLLNARRCGRTHCWVVGVLLPVWAAVGVGILLGSVPLPWTTYGSALWLIIVGAFVAEAVCGPYLGTGSSSASR